MTGAGEDKLAREVAISASLEENGVKLRATSRAVSALDRLVGAALDWPAAFFEGAAGKKRLSDEIDAQLRRAQAAVAEAQIAGNQALGGVLIDSVLVEGARKQKNVSGVAIEAVEAMKALPPPTSEETHSEGNQADDNLDSDWMNMFIRFAEDASSEQLQQLWGRVLAGEVRKSGSFSRQTLRFIAELDTETAATCEWAANYTVDGIIPKFDQWNSGKPFANMIDLQRLGLIDGVGGFGPNRKYTFDAAGNVTIQYGETALHIEGDPGAEVKIGAIIITRLGKEVFSLLPSDPKAQILKDIANHFPKDNIRKISFGRVVPEPGGLRFFTEEILWPL
jgi:hypothetical protein